MSLIEQQREATFGLGGGEPYARALRHGARAGRERAHSLVLHEVGARGLSPRLVMDFAKWSAAADDTDRELLENAHGPVLDIGCGPGRMVRAAGEIGLMALGVDVSEEAVSLARAAGLAAVQGSVFDRMPAEGLWQTALLVDGNVGIGGDVSALIERCHDLLSPGGDLVVELNPDTELDHSYTAALVDEGGARSEEFPWAEVGLTRIRQLAERCGFVLADAWLRDTRRFCRLARA